MKITQHIPSFIEGPTPKTHYFDTLKELLLADWIQGWSTEEKFFRFSISDYTKTLKLLMAELNDGKKWWVVGYIKGYDKNLELPIFEPKYEATDPTRSF